MALSRVMQPMCATHVLKIFARNKIRAKSLFRDLNQVRNAQFPEQWCGFETSKFGPVIMDEDKLTIFVIVHNETGDLEEMKKRSKKFRSIELAPNTTLPEARRKGKPQKWQEIFRRTKKSHIHPVSAAG